MDPLADTIALLKLEQLSWKELIARGPWALSFPQTSGVVFALVAAGVCILQREGEEDRALQSGDFVLLNRPPIWRLTSSPYDALSSSEVTRTKAGDARFAQIGEGDDPAARILGGHFRLNLGHTGMLDGIIPSSIIVRGGEATSSRLGRLLDLLGEEARAERPSRDLVIQRLLELVLVETLRGERLDRAVVVGLLAGLADARLAKALQAMHRDPAARWTVADLADEARMSRSVFAELFQRIVGLAPIAYLGRWRMLMAAKLLTEGRPRLSEVADRCGYGTASAFSTAFTRTFGCSPAAYRLGDAHANAK